MSKRKLGLGNPIPTDGGVVILGIEVQDVLNFGEACTPAVLAAIPQAVQMVPHELASD